MICPHCDQKIKPQGRFCPVCGQQVLGKPPASVPVAETPPHPSRGVPAQPPWKLAGLLAAQVPALPVLALSVAGLVVAFATVALTPTMIPNESAEAVPALILLGLLCNVLVVGGCTAGLAALIAFAGSALKHIRRPPVVASYRALLWFGVGSAVAATLITAITVPDLGAYPGLPWDTLRAKWVRDHPPASQAQRIRRSADSAGPWNRLMREAQSAPVVSAPRAAPSSPPPSLSHEDASRILYGGPPTPPVPAAEILRQQQQAATQPSYPTPSGRAPPWSQPAMPAGGYWEPGGGGIVESRIDGGFEGWDGDTLFKLENGQIWEQVSYAYMYHYAYCPEVTIFPQDGGYKMAVEGVDETIEVQQLK